MTFLTQSFPQTQNSYRRPSTNRDACNDISRPVSASGFPERARRLGILPEASFETPGSGNVCVRTNLHRKTPSCELSQ